MTQYERRDSRLRVIYDNGSESDVLVRSLQRALHRDEAGRRITDPAAGPLFAEEADDDDLASGTIYVLRSKSDHPVVAAHRDVLHKIGVTGADVDRRIGNARLDPTFLMADVEVIGHLQTFQHQPDKARKSHPSDLRSGTARYRNQGSLWTAGDPREWFLVPLFVVHEERIRDGTITEYAHDPKMAALVRV